MTVPKERLGGIHARENRLRERGNFRAGEEIWGERIVRSFLNGYRGKKGRRPPSVGRGFENRESARWEA